MNEKNFQQIFPLNFSVSGRLRGSQSVRCELRGECLRQQNGCKTLLNTVYIPFEMLNVLSFPDSGRQIAVKNKTAIKFKRQRLFRIIVAFTF